MSDPWGSLEALTAVQRAQLEEVQGRTSEERDEALRRSDREKAKTRTRDLSARQLQILRMVAEGKTNVEIGDELFITGDTVNTHIQKVLLKLGAVNRAHAVALGFRAALIE